MPLFADVDPTAAAIAGPFGAVVAGLLLLLYVWDKWSASRAASRKAEADSRVTDARAEEAETAADERAIKQHIAFNRVLSARLKRVEEESDAHKSRLYHVEAELGAVKKSHADCEKRQTENHAQIDALKAQNGGQQGMIDSLTARIVALVGALRDNGVPVGSGPHAPLSDQTGEHTPV